MTANRRLEVWIPSWMIQDGMYPDLSIGHVLHRALEFRPQSLAVTTNHERSLSRHGFASYDGCRPLVFVAPRAVVVDFDGVSAYRLMKDTAGWETDQWVESRFQLSVDFFTYEEHLRTRPGVPELRHNLEIIGILRETTPWIEREEPPGLVKTRDKSKESFVAVPATDAWNDDNGDASYILDCEILDGGTPNR